MEAESIVRQHSNVHANEMSIMIKNKPKLIGLTVNYNNNSSSSDESHSMQMQLIHNKSINS